MIRRTPNPADAGPRPSLAIARATTALTAVMALLGGAHFLTNAKRRYR